MLRAFVTLTLLATFAPFASAAPFDQMDYGPFLSGTYIANWPAGNDTLKGIAVRLKLDPSAGPRPEGPISGGYSNRPRMDVSGAEESEQEIYKAQRFPCPGYRLNVPAGTFKVTLKFGDCWQIEPGKRVFDIVIQGKKVVEKLDLIAKAGRNTAYDVVQDNVTVAEGEQLAIDLVKITGDTSLAGLVVEGKNYKRKINCGGGKIGDYDADWPAGFTLATNNTVGGMLFDTELLRWSAGWTGGFVRYQGVVFDGGHGTNPSPLGQQLIGTRATPGWAKDGKFDDPRAVPHGPLPREHARYRGLYRHEKGIVFEYTVGDTTVFELADTLSLTEGTVFRRTMEIGPTKGPLAVLVCDVEKSIGRVIGDTIAALDKDGQVTLASLYAAPAGAKLETETSGRIILHLPAMPNGAKLRLDLWNGPAASEKGVLQAVNRDVSLTNLSELRKGGAANWKETVETKGTRAADDAPYVVDKLSLPDENPWKSWMRTGGFDLFSDGRIAVSTWSGDVWIVSGIDDKLEKLTWRRYASGLFHALGLKIVDDTVYVLGRDQITRLRDLNNDGEADAYECFNNDVTITKNFHEFTFELHTDPAGNFYFIKGGPVRPGGSGWDKIVPHHGCLMRVSKDGSKLDVVARGFRAPNGMGLGPDGQLTTGDNEGTWTPAVPLNWIKEGGFYGVPEFSAKTPLPVVRDNPLCWMPKSVDNSNGGQVWIPAGKFGPLGGALIHLSYGQSKAYRVLWEKAGDQVQGGVVALPWKFDTGVMRGRFDAKNDCLYLCGLRGWQTNAARDGGLYRIRYTGKEFNFPAAMSVKPEGITLTFEMPLDKTQAANPDNYQLTEWNYRWTQSYGSKHYKVSDPKTTGEDEVEIDEAIVSADGKSVTLKIADLHPVMQMKIGYNLKSASGAPLKQEIYSSINVVGSKRGEIHPGEYKVVETK